MAFFDGSAQRAKQRPAATHMTFRVGGQLYAVKLDMVAQVARAGAITPISDGDPAVIGQTDLRASAVIVVDMGIRLQGKPVWPRENAFLIVVKREGARSACLLDAPEDIVSIDPSDIRLSGCLVEEAAGVVGIAPGSEIKPENASLSGRERGFPVCETERGAILFPDSELFYPM